MIRLSKRHWLKFVRTRHRLFFPSLIVLVIAALAVLSIPHPNRVAVAPKSDINPAGVVVYSATKPGTAAVTTAAYTSSTTGSEPAYISLPSIKAQGYIQKVGIDQYGHMAVPTNIHLAGWYVESVLPGSKGLSIINGHIDIPSDPGIFQHIDALKSGDTYQLKLANGLLQTYIVKQVETLPLDQVPAVLYSQAPGITRELNLITCNGTYNQHLKTFNDRIVVISSFVGQQ
jgi:LPXTG-site transpeptidase (sortase) family protein